MTRKKPDATEASSRDRMVAGAARLLATQGLQGTSFSEVLALTGAPRGSIYHHFPGGKDELVLAALDLVTAQMGRVLEAKAGASAEAVAETFLGAWRLVLTRSRFESGCAVVAVTVAAGSDPLVERVSLVFRAWRERLAELLAQGGLTPARARRFAATLVAASEGAVILARGERSLEPFELVADGLLEDVRRLTKKKT